MKSSVEERNLFPAHQEREHEHIPQLLDKAFYLTESDLAHWYSIGNDGKIKCRKSKGIFISSSCEDSNEDWVEFILDCQQMIVQNNRENPLFPELFLHRKMQSVLVYPLITEGSISEILLLNSLETNHFGQKILYKAVEFSAHALFVLTRFLQDRNHAKHSDSKK
ncbi:hypothetical protein [Oceanispirochaeta sp.]|jgi:hypothetical protein|uniref:hypothetical protein n=1 Tax=Oceanispirochaeta sp. TaxID=2035350 RepID=UPI00262BE0AB|nr:hypothetical protein [Oceanispirochaeta sp.]MDA3956760.1 hypothetical protein [Oceanispirochaeta sp.]